MEINKIYNEDCLETMAKMPDNFVDYSFTSPPYNRKRNDKYLSFNDINNNWFEFNINVITELLRVTKNQVFYNIQSNFYNRKDVYKIIGLFSDKIVDIHIWEKSNPMPASGNNITNAVEFFIILGDKSLKSNTTYTKNIITTSVNSNMPKEHKAVMKIEVAEHFIHKFTKENDLIYDCFMGIGTSALVCKKYNRNYIGSEITKEYFDLSIENLN
jgi:site-specific DNA-methyltransferase (adenine-specific)/modification methylase